jgi:hypothetical protein
MPEVTNREYELITIKDIFDKVPADRIEVCMDELKISLVQAKSTVEMLEVIAEQIGEKGTAETVCPEKFIWVDDGLGINEQRWNVNGKPIMSMKTTTDHSR